MIVPANIGPTGFTTENGLIQMTTKAAKDVPELETIIVSLTTCPEHRSGRDPKMNISCEKGCLLALSWIFLLFCCESFILIIQWNHRDLIHARRRDDYLRKHKHGVC